MKLPLLSSSTAALETCVYCPKLCRAACPVSEAEASETLTPWGKMSLAFFLARGDLALEGSYTKAAWACTGCLACQSVCNHKNPVAQTLTELRAEAFSRGFAPPEVLAAFGQAQARELKYQAALGELIGHPGLSGASRIGLSLGEQYICEEIDLSWEAISVLAALVGPVRLLREPGGSIWRDLGHAAKAAELEQALMNEAAGLDTLVFLDPDSGAQLRGLGARSLLEVVAEHLAALRPIVGLAGRHYRWHDPCKLGRGMGVYQAPRAILQRILGEPPLEFQRNREAGLCSGGGALLPLSYPQAAQASAQRRIAEHAALGGGVVVTGCAGSLKRFRVSGAETLDIVHLIAKSLGVSRAALGS